jgi:phage terminase large subunit-like protein
MNSNRVELASLHEKQIEIARSFQEHKKVVIRCGRRFGKTALLERCAAKWAFQGQRVGWLSPQYKLNTPTYSNLIQTLKPVIASKSKTDAFIQLKTGGQVEFWTLENEDAGRSRKYHKVIIDEASLKGKGLKEIIDQALRPTLLDFDGSIIMAGTPKGIDQDNYFYEACTNPLEGWFEHHAPTSLNPHLNADVVARLKDDYPALVYQQEYLAEFVDWRGSAFFSEDSLLVDGLPVPMPTKCTQVFAVIDTAIKDGQEHDGTGVIYYAKSRYHGTPLVILDYDVLQIQGSLLIDWLPSVNARCEELAKLCNASYGNIGQWIEDKASGIVLIQQAQRMGMKAHPIDGVLTSAGKEGRALSVSGYVFRGDVKISDYAYNKIINYKGQSRNHLLSQVCSFRVGQKDGARDLLDCFTYGVGISLGNSKGI